MPEPRHYSAKHERWPDHVSKGDQAIEQSSESTSGLVHVKDYDRHQAGKIVHVKDYDRRNPYSEHEEGHDQAGDYDANYDRGHKDAYRKLLNLKNPLELWDDEDFLRSHPGYKRGVYDALREMRQDPMYQKGFQDAGNGTVDPDNKMPYYLLGAQENMFGDSVGLEADPHTFLDIAPIGRAKNLGAVLKDPRRIPELAKDMATRKALEKVRGTVLNWKKGDPIFDKTTKGNDPKWSTIRRRYWINKALTKGAAKKWTPENLERMKGGSAPEVINPRTGKREKIHLHHPEGREGIGWQKLEEVPASDHYKRHNPER